MEIYLVQHGAAYTKDEDSERHLNDDGLKQCHVTGKALKRLRLDFDLIFCSPKARAHQTAVIIAEEVGYPKDQIKVTPTLEPTVPAEDAVSYLKDFTDKNNMLLAGHLPSLGEIASELLSETARVSVHFEMGGVCRIDVEQLPTHKGDFRWFLLPEHLNLIAQS
ncbi:MAG: phosphohistidine phosphatase SixA [Candidatus Scalinduaceae bacterium]